MPDTANNSTDANAAPTPAYFLSLSASNFRCFGPEQTLDLSDGNGRPAKWTVLLGENGVGKTTLLQVMATLHNDLEYVTLNATESVRISARFWVGDINISLPSSVVAASLKGGRKGVGFPTVPLQIKSAAPCIGYGANRESNPEWRSHQRTNYASIEPYASSKTLFDLDDVLPSPNDWLLESDYSARINEGQGNNKQRQRLSKVIQTLLALLPDVSDFRFSTTNDTRMAPRVEALTPYGWVRVADLSLGYKTALTWMVDLASRLFDRYPNSPNPLAEPAVVLVDEIDLHLHPKWQRELLQTLSETFPNAQFIVTAHSPLVVQAAPNANLALLRREGDHVVIENDVDYIRKWRVDQILASELFGETDTHAPEVETLLDERTRLLSKSRLTKHDETRVAEIDYELNELPTSANGEDQKAIDLVRKTAALLRAKGK